MVLSVVSRRRLVTKVDNISAFKSLIDFDCPAKLSWGIARWFALLPALRTWICHIRRWQQLQLLTFSVMSGDLPWDKYEQRGTPNVISEWNTAESKETSAENNYINILILVKTLSTSIQARYFFTCIEWIVEWKKPSIALNITCN